MIENLKKKVFHLFLGISLKRRLFITYLLLSSLILMLTSVFFYTASKKVLIKRAALSSQQQLSLSPATLEKRSIIYQTMPSPFPSTAISPMF